MQDPTNQGGDWQQVPTSNPGAVDAPASGVYGSPGSGYAPGSPGYQAAQPGGYSPQPQQPGGYPPPQGVAAQSSDLSPTAAAAISYITIIPAIIFLVMDPYKRIPLVRFHAMQCLFFNAAVFAFYLVMGVCWGIVVHLIPLLALAGLLIWPVFGLLFMAIWILLIFKASKGEWFKLPVIGDIAMKQANS